MDPFFTQPCLSSLLPLYDKRSQPFYVTKYACLSLGEDSPKGRLRLKRPSALSSSWNPKGSQRRTVPSPQQKRLLSHEYYTASLPYY